MSRYLCTELRKISTEEERMRLVAEEISRIMENKKKRNFVQKLLNKKPTTQPKGW
jgi:uncharacterized membrane-anchored protein